MKLLREYIDILFRRIQPEVLLKYLQHMDTRQEREFIRLNSREISLKIFRHYSGLNFSGYSADEVENLYYNMLRYMEGRQSPVKSSVFHIIPRYMEHIIDSYEKIPKCRYQEVLNWRDASHRIGQDTLLMAQLAYSDWEHRHTRTFFAWNSVISTDNVRLRQILKRGTAENHFHLYGSTQLFPLSWICLMNHPDKIEEYFRTQDAGRHMAENLNENITLGVMDNQMEWKERLRIACWLRKELFQCLRTPQREEGACTMTERLQAFMQFPPAVGLADEVNALRCNYGVRFRQPDFSSGVCLDYAITDLEGIGKKYRFNAVLTGERRFLYDCFYQCCAGMFSKEAQDLFYLYLLIKVQFRSELIQVNQRCGFHNFSDYQSRKADFWWNVREYIYESHKLALNASLTGEDIRSLEARITPKRTWQENVNTVLKIDRDVDFANTTRRHTKKKIQKNGRKSEYFFVIHFIKEKLQRADAGQGDAYGISEAFMERPRHDMLRKRSKTYARELKKAIQKSDYYADRVWGIDACSAEIGCRPEVFAPDFRFLRYIRRDGKDENKRLRITYHAGEDFLDIADGLRAIDEAMFFLQMGNGDRFGHALALGIAPKAHYESKRRLAVLPKQDLLDDYVWLLFRSLELGVVMDSQLRSSLEYEAEKLLRHIYKQDERFSFTLKDYFESWKLRGDHPDLYRKGEFADQKTWPDFDGYDRERKLRNDNLDVIREQKQITCLYYRYQFGTREKELGQETGILRVEDDYIELVRRMQTRLMKLVFEKGIAIECNPSSNVLIGTFDRYMDHPIRRFNSYALQDKENKDPVQLSVSINTDDQGVFDTLLENEYALMACALEKEKDASGEYLYSQDMIYDYLEHIRQMGFDQVFRQ